MKIIFFNKVENIEKKEKKLLMMSIFFLFSKYFKNSMWQSASTHDKMVIFIRLKNGTSRKLKKTDLIRRCCHCKTQINMFSFKERSDLF